MRFALAAFTLVLSIAALASAQSGWTNLGQGLAGSNGTPQLTNTWGVLAPGGNYGWELNHCVPHGSAFLVTGANAISAPFKGGVLVPYPLFIYPPAGQWTGPGGLFTFGGIWPSAVPAGVTMYFQYWVKDAGGPHGWAASNAVMKLTD